MEGLRSAAGFIRRELAHSLNMRNTPEITFKLDTSIERGVEMSRLIDEVMQKDRESEVRNEEDYADEN
jgi:ribosome-binding factor A